MFSIYKIISILLPATFLSESPITDIPKRNIPNEPSRVKIFSIILCCLQPSLREDNENV